MLRKTISSRYYRHFCGFESSHLWFRFPAELLLPSRLIHFIHQCRHHQGIPTSRYLRLSPSPFPSAIVLSKSSRRHPVTTQNCYIYQLCVDTGCCLEDFKIIHVFTGRLTVVFSRVGVHRKYQCSACLVHLSWMVREIGGKWPYSCFFVSCCFQDLFRTARSILV